MRRKPYSVLLLDEIEKAHPDVFNILLQILEDGRLTDAQGRTVDFRNAIVIMTSNIGAADIARNTPLGFAVSDDETGVTYDDMKSKIMGELKKVFRPEFLNRIDEVIVFHKLAKDEIMEIVDLMISRVRAQVAEHELQLDLTQGAKELLVDKGWDPAMGARPLRRAIQRYIEDPLADEVLKAGDLTPGTTVNVERDEKGDDEDKPLKLKLVKPRKRPAKPKKKRRAREGRRRRRQGRRRLGRRRLRGRSLGRLGRVAQQPGPPGSAKAQAASRRCHQVWSPRPSPPAIPGARPRARSAARPLGVEREDLVRLSPAAVPEDPGRGFAFGRPRLTARSAEPPPSRDGCRSP